eukprot:gene5765-6063_t
MFNLPNDDDDTSEIEKDIPKCPRAGTDFASMVQRFRPPEAAEPSPLSPDSVFSEPRPLVGTGAGEGIGPNAAVNAVTGGQLSMGGLRPAPPDAAVPGGRLGVEGGLSPAPQEPSPHQRIARGESIHPSRRVSLSTLTSSADKGFETKSSETKAAEMNALLSSLYGTAKPAKAAPHHSTSSRRRSLVMDPDQMVNLRSLGGNCPTANVGTAYLSGSTDGSMWPLPGTTDGARAPLSGNTDGARPLRIISGTGHCTSELGVDISSKGADSPKGSSGGVDSLHLSSITVTKGSSASPARGYPSPPASPRGAWRLDVAPPDSPALLDGGLLRRMSRLFLSPSGPRAPEGGPEDEVLVSRESEETQDRMGEAPPSSEWGFNIRRPRRSLVTEGPGGGPAQGGSTYGSTPGSSPGGSRRSSFEVGSSPALKPTRRGSLPGGTPGSTAGSTAGGTMQHWRRSSLGESQPRPPDLVFEEGQEQGQGQGMAAGGETGPPPAGSPRRSAEQLSRFMQQRESASMSIHSLSSLSSKIGDNSDKLPSIPTRKGWWRA